MKNIPVHLLSSTYITRVFKKTKTNFFLMNTSEQHKATRVTRRGPNNGFNNTGLRFGDHRTKEILLGVVDSKSLTGFKLCATTYNRECKRTQHVTPYNFKSSWPNSFRQFAGSFNSRRLQPFPSSWSCA